MSRLAYWIDEALTEGSTTWSVICLKVCSAGPRADLSRLFKTVKRPFFLQTHLKLVLLSLRISPVVRQI